MAVAKSDDDSSVWIASPNTTDSSGNPPFEEAFLYIPSPDSTEKGVGFLETNGSTTAGAESAGFITYGSFVMHRSDAGTLETLWYALATDDASVWTLNWNATDDIGVGIPLTIKTNPPSGAGSRPDLS